MHSLVRVWSRRSWLFACSLLLAAGCSSESGGHVDTQGHGGGDAVPVVAIAALQRDVPVEVRAIGNVEPYSTIAIKPQVDGQLAEVHFQEGQRVQQGDLLFVIDPRPFEATLRQAEANLAKTRAEAANAGTELRRRSELLTQGFVSQDEYDQTFARDASLRAAVQADAAAVENAKLLLQYCSIRSPIDGRVGQILVHPGNIVERTKTTLAVVNQIRPVYITFAVPERELPEIRRRAADGDLSIEATIAGDSAPPARGQLSFINNTVDMTTGTVMLKGLFTNESESLWPGQFVDVSLTLSVQRDVVVVATEAVQTGQQGAYVFVVTPEHTVKTRSVTVDHVSTEGTVISSGLAPGEVVVTDGQVRLTDGSRVEVKIAPDHEPPRALSDARAP